MMNTKTILAISAISSSLLLSACGSSSNSTPPLDDVKDVPEVSTPPSIDENGVQEMSSLITIINQAQTAITTLQTQPQKVPFLSRLNVGEKSILATQGVLSVEASCGTEAQSDGPRPLMVTTPSESGSALTIRYISSTTGSLTDERQDEATEGEIYTITNHSGRYADVDIDESSILATTGDFISINGETMLLSTDAQGSDCMVAGMAVTMKGSPAPASFEAI